MGLESSLLVFWWFDAGQATANGRRQLPEKPVICILGSTTFNDPKTEEIGDSHGIWLFLVFRTAVVNNEKFRRAVNNEKYLLILDQFVSASVE